MMAKDLNRLFVADTNSRKIEDISRNKKPPLSLSDNAVIDEITINTIRKLDDR